MKKSMKKLLCLITALMMCFGTAAIAACNSDEGDKDDKQEETKTPEEGSGENNGNVDGDGDGNGEGEGEGEGEKTEPDVTIDYDGVGSEYIVGHTDGETVEYVFEAECTNLENKSGSYYSGNAAGSNMAISATGASNGGVVSYLYDYGDSVNFIIVSDREVTDATLILRCGAEFNDVMVDGNSITVRVDPVPAEYAEAYLKPYREGGAWGMWDKSFLDYYSMDLTTDENGDLVNWNFQGQWLSTFACGSIHINALNVMSPTGIDDFLIATNLHIYEGVTSISFVTNNRDIPAHTETQKATAVAIDCIKIITTAQLGLYNPQDNGFGALNATYTKYEG